jgi:hypothetical protein
MTPVFVLAIATLLTAGGTVPPAPRPDAQVMSAFQKHIGEYMEIHRMAAAGLGDPVFCADPEELTRQSAALAAAIRDARPLADEGDIFTAAIAAAFRARIAKAVHTSKFTLVAPAEQDEGFGVAVHNAIRAGVWDYAWAPILHALPDLPPELEYQFVDRHLVLVDVRAGLVVDLIRYALPAPRRPRDIGPDDACDVHPDLPACWM